MNKTELRFCNETTWGTHPTTQRKAMKRTAIRYIDNKNGTVRITGIDNAATAADIKKEFGVKVWDEYSGGRPCYHGINDNQLWLHPSNSNPTWFVQIEKDDIYTHEEFASIIGTLQQAGNRLIEIAKANPIEKIVLI